MTDTEAQAQNDVVMSDQEELDKLIKQLPAPDTFGKLKVTTTEFEKADDSNGHIDFIVGKKT